MQRTISDSFMRIFSYTIMVLNGLVSDTYLDGAPYTHPTVHSYANLHFAEDNPPRNTADS